LAVLLGHVPCERAYRVARLGPSDRHVKYTLSPFPGLGTPPHGTVRPGQGREVGLDTGARNEVVETTPAQGRRITAVEPLGDRVRVDHRAVLGVVDEYPLPAGRKEVTSRREQTLIVGLV